MYFMRKTSNNGRLVKGAWDGNSVCGYVLKADIKKYFDYVDHKVLVGIIRRKIKDERVLWLVKVILNNFETQREGKGMPLGNYTSQFFANVYLNELDYFVKHILKARYYIQKDGGDKIIRKLVTIATPHYGIVDVAAFGADLRGANESKQMIQNSPFLNNLNSQPDTLVDTYTFAGNISKQPIKFGTYCTNCDGVVYAHTASLKAAKENVVQNGKNYSHSSIYNQPDVAQKVLVIVKK